MEKHETFIPLEQALSIETEEAEADWISITPPFTGLTHTDESITDIYRSMTISSDMDADKSTGFIKLCNRIETEDDDSGGIRSGFTMLDCRAGFSCGYTVPKTGRIQTEILLKNILGRHSCALQDEIGFSDSAVGQIHSIYVKIQNLGEKILTTLSSWGESSYTNGSWNESYLTKDQTYHYYLTSNAIFEKDTRVNLLFGVTSYHFVYCDDVKVNSEMHFRWNVERFSVRIVE